jgi:hypothetical protein
MWRRSEHLADGKMKKVKVNVPACRRVSSFSGMIQTPASGDQKPKSIRIAIKNSF